MVKLEIGKRYKTECGQIIHVISCDPLDGTTLEYECSDNFYRDRDGKVFPVETFSLFAHDSTLDVKEEW